MAEIDIRKQRQGALSAALSETKPGDCIIYHEGENMMGCPHRQAVMQAASAGLVAPVAKRLGPRNFLFIAQRTRPRK